MLRVFFDGLIGGAEPAPPSREPPWRAGASSTAMSETRQRSAARRAMVHAMLSAPTDAQYAAMTARDARHDGWFVVAVTSTGIYCRPSCPARTPRREPVRIAPTAAAAQAAGFRACRRCRPDASPGSPDWDARGDVAGRAMRLIGDGIVDREGVPGLARRLGYSERHLHRVLVGELGAGPIGLARAHRAQTARILIETTDLPMGQVALGAGFASLRQFNDTIREIFATTPTELRERRARRSAPTAGNVTLRLAYRPPLDERALWSFLARRRLPGVESVDAEGLERTLTLPHGHGRVRLQPGGASAMRCELALEDFRDLSAAVARCRALLDLDADPVAADDLLGADPLLGASVRAAPGRRVPGAVDGFELAVRAILGQQVSVAAARTLAGRLVGAFGAPCRIPPLTGTDSAPARCFPTATTLARADLSALGIPASRASALRGLAEAVALGTLSSPPAPTAPRRSPGCARSAASARGPRVRPHARAPRPRPLPRRRPRRATAPRRSRRPALPRRGRRRGRALATLALLRAHAPLGAGAAAGAQQLLRTAHAGDPLTTVHTTLAHPQLGEIVLVAGDAGLHQLTFTGQRHEPPDPGRVTARPCGGDPP